MFIYSMAAPHSRPLDPPQMLLYSSPGGLDARGTLEWPQEKAAWEMPQNQENLGTI